MADVPFEAVTAKMTELLIAVVEAADQWTGEAVRPGSKEESDAHEDLVHAILAYADEYEGFGQMMKALHPSSGLTE